MYLRIRDEQDHHKTKAVKPNTLVQSLIFTIIIILAILFSSLRSFADPPALLADSLNSNKTVYFDFGKFELKEESMGLLKELADRLKNNPEIKIEIYGHTDNIGSEMFNNTLSINRAEKVKDYLMELGVKAEQIITHGEGFSKPLNDNSTEDLKALNRRVEFNWILPPSGNLPVQNDESFANTGNWRSNGSEITGNLTVRDTAGEPVSDITENDVSAVLKWKQNDVEDSTAGSVKLFPIDDKKKIAFSFTMDYSGSMFDDSISRFPKKSDQVIHMEKAVISFIDNMKENCYARIIKFGAQIRELVKYTRSKSTLRDAVVNYTENLMGTALYRSIWSALSDTTFNSNPTVMKTVIAFTDGEENSSGIIGKRDIYKLTEKSGIKVFTVGLLEDFKHSEPAGLKMTGEADLVEIANRTGGFYYWAEDPAALQQIYKQINDQIMKSYNISILWEGNALPPKGTQVTAVIRIKVKGLVRTINKNYEME